MTNQNKPGYKHTPLGWIPDEWYTIELEKCFTLSSGKTKPSELTQQPEGEHIYPVYGGNGIVGYSNQYNIEGENIIIGRVGEYCGVTRYLNIKAWITDNALLTKEIKDDFDPLYLSYKLQQENISKLRSKGGQPLVSQTPIYLHTVSVAKCKQEQRRIAAILSTWDEAITKAQQVIAQLQQRNKGLMHQLLSGKRRLRGFNNPWEEIHLSDAFNERNESGYLNLNLLSVGSLGVYPQCQSEKRDTSNSDKAKYKRICPGDIGYNTMRMWQGRSALSSLEGIVSPAYTIVTPKKGQHSQFYAYFFKLPSVVNKFFRNSQGLVEDTLNCKFKDFAKVKVEVPEYEEQIAIANVLKTAQLEIKSFEQKLNALQLQKKGLMQKLLTGDVRVKIN